jgi:cell division protein FtsW
MTFIQRYMKGDKVIWIIALIISVYSLLAVYSSAGQLAFRYKGGNTEYYLIQRFIMLGLGMLLMFGAHRLKYTIFSKLSIIGLIASIPLLLITLIIGTNLNDASRWLTIPGVPISFQTSDLAKIVLLIYVARTLAKKQEVIKDLKEGFLPIVIPVLLVCGLILPANFSTAALLFSNCLVLMFIGRCSIKHIMSLIGIAIAGFTLLILLSYPLPKLMPRATTWRARVEVFFGLNDKVNTTTVQANNAQVIDEDEYQVSYAKMAIADGGLLGTGPANNLNKYRLPQSYSDFIFAMIIGEYGFIFGGLIILLAYLILMYRAIRIAQKSEFAFATFLALGLCFSLVLQALVNMCVAVNIFPVTGQPLPMVSMGGTSTLFTGLTLGIILSVSRTLNKADENPPVEDL